MKNSILQKNIGKFKEKLKNQKQLALTAKKIEQEKELKTKQVKVNIQDDQYSQMNNQLDRLNQEFTLYILFIVVINQ